MRYRVRGKLSTGQPIIVKPEADDAFQAAALAGKMIRDAGHNPANISDVVVRPLSSAKSSVYVGTVPSTRKGKKPAAAPAAATPAANAGTTAAVEAATEAVAAGTPVPVTGKGKNK